MSRPAASPPPPMPPPVPHEEEGDAQVLVVGAGPVGLFTAVALLQRGVTTRVVEKRGSLTPLNESKSIMLHPRTIEILHSQGLHQRLAPYTVSTSHSVVLDHHGALLADVQYASVKPDTLFPSMFIVPQGILERVLYERLLELGGIVEWDSELTALLQRTGDVQATFADGTRSFHRYVIGCDGADGVVSSLIGNSAGGAAANASGSVSPRFSEHRHAHQHHQHQLQHEHQHQHQNRGSQGMLSSWIFQPSLPPAIFADVTIQAPGLPSDAITIYLLPKTMCIFFPMHNVHEGVEPTAKELPPQPSFEAQLFDSDQPRCFRIVLADLGAPDQPWIEVVKSPAPPHTATPPPYSRAPAGQTPSPYRAGAQSPHTPALATSPPSQHAAPSFLHAHAQTHTNPFFMPVYPSTAPSPASSVSDDMARLHLNPFFLPEAAKVGASTSTSDVVAFAGSHRAHTTGGSSTTTQPSPTPPMSSSSPVPSTVYSTASDLSSGSSRSVSFTTFFPSTGASTTTTTTTTKVYAPSIGGGGLGALASRSTSAVGPAHTGHTVYASVSSPALSHGGALQHLQHVHRQLSAGHSLDGAGYDFDGGDEHERIDMHELPQYVEPGDFSSAFADVARVAGVHVREIFWLSRHVPETRLAERYRLGRVFIGGDAAHSNNMFGGHGLNVGLQDALNLAWKLAMTLQGAASESLLDTYEEERRTVARQMIDNAETLAQILGTRSGPLQSVRNLALTFSTGFQFVHDGLSQAMTAVRYNYCNTQLTQGPFPAGYTLPPVRLLTYPDKVECTIHDLMYRRDELFVLFYCPNKCSATDKNWMLLEESAASIRCRFPPALIGFSWIVDDETSGQLAQAMEDGLVFVDAFKDLNAVCKNEPMKIFVRPDGHIGAVLPVESMQDLIYLSKILK